MKELDSKMKKWKEWIRVELCGTVLEMEESKDEKELQMCPLGKQKAVQNKLAHLPHELASVKRLCHQDCPQGSLEGVQGCGKDREGSQVEQEAVEE